VTHLKQLILGVLNMKIRTLLPSALAALLVLSFHPVDAQERRLGWIEFDNSGTEAAQKSFLEATLLLHSFEFEDAAIEFRAAQNADPDFALAYWGEAMTYNHPLWQQQDRAAATAALNRYAPSPDARQAKAPSPREAQYLAAIDVLYGDGDKGTRDRAYMNAMGRLADAHPEDLEARVFYSLSILGSTDGERDFATYVRAAAQALPVSEANPQHPGAVHYIIHSFDDPVHAPLGLAAARAYSEIAPDAGHAQHMTSHIFVAMGLWDDLVAANIRARDVQNGREAELGRRPNVCGHYTSWLHYGWLQRGEVDAAERGMAECHERVASGNGDRSEANYFANMRARHVLDLGDWDAAARLGADLEAHPLYTFISGVAAIKSGDRGGAQAALTRLAAGPLNTQPRLRIAHMELAALLAQDGGDIESAIGLLTQAADLEETLPFEFGPPASVMPPHEALGAVLLQAGQPRAAADAFRKALDFAPERMASLIGLAAASLQSGDEATAQSASERLSLQVRFADAAFRQRMGFDGGRN
jgi:tetratricopeptide (TPR) repeat protein